MAFKATQLDPSISSIILRVADVFIAAVPTSIPAVISFGLFRCVRALKRKDVHAHDVPRYQIAMHACSNGAFARHLDDLAYYDMMLPDIRRHERYWQRICNTVTNVE